MGSVRSRRWSGVRRGIAAAATIVALAVMTGGRGTGAAESRLASSTPISAAASIDLTALFHDSRRDLYRTPGGAVPAGTAVLLRVRTLHDDATAVQLFEKQGTRSEQIEMRRVVSEIPCGDPAPDAGADAACDLWEIGMTWTSPATVEYHFVVEDGSATAYVSDDARGDGGPGLPAASLSNPDWIVTVYDPAFEPVSWLQGAVVYQVFPDRFANGSTANDADTDDARYGYPPDATDRIIREPWGAAPPSPSSGGEYYGGDLAGIRSRLPYLRDLGATVIYLNPIFASASNHGYDTRDPYAIDPRFGTQAEFEALVRDASDLGIRVILDGVFDHVSSDSPYFDAYGRYPDAPDGPGACESVTSPYRSWFTFTPEADGPCAGPDGPNTTDYASWNSVASLPLLDKKNPAVQEFIYGAEDAVALHWLGEGIGGWRVDTMAHPSFPAGFWQAFRAAVKAARADAAIVGEAWQRYQVLPLVRGDTADTVMDYRSRSAILAYLGVSDFRSFPDDGASNLPATVLASELSGIREDEPAAVARTAFVLLDSHDTERALWSLTPGSDAAKELPENLALGTARLRLASLIQFTLPGSPVIYYGDEAGLTGANDPDNRRTFPSDGGDRGLTAWYRALAAARTGSAALRVGDLRFLLADDASRAIVYARTANDGLVIVAVNPSADSVTLDVPLAQPIDDGTPIRDGIRFDDALGGAGATSEAGYLRMTLPPVTGALLVPGAGQDVEAPPSPIGLSASRSAEGVELHWASPGEPATFTIWRSPVSGGGYELVGSASGTAFVDRDAPAQELHYVLRAADAAGNVSEPSADLVVSPASEPWPGASEAPASTAGASAAGAPSSSGPTGSSVAGHQTEGRDLDTSAITAAIAVAAFGLAALGILLAVRIALRRRSTSR